ncbi:MAG: hypothetical protein CM15mV10_1270 [uncultured marine virus]|nr:MAG: hypothetical protein CM15mV10_1270 [uncultured marine virus]
MERTRTPHQLKTTHVYRQGGSFAFKKGYEWNLDTWSTQDSVPASVIKEVLETGFLYIKEASRFTRKINELAKEIEKEYGYQTDAHIYATLNPDLPHPLGAHIDDNDNVIVKCEGATNWKVWDKMDVIPDSRKDWVNLDLDKPPALDVTLLPVMLCGFQNTIRILQLLKMIDYQ